MSLLKPDRSEFASSASVFDTSGSPPHEAYAQWRDGSLSGMPKVCQVSGDVSKFFVRQRVRRLSRAALLDVKMSALSFRRTAQQVRSDHIDGLWIEIARGRGGSRLTTDKGTVVDLKGEVGVCDLGRPFLREAVEADFIAVSLPRDMFSEDDIQALHGSTLGGARARLISDYIQGLLEAPDPIDVRQVEVNLAAVLRAAVSESADRAHEAAHVLGPLALHQARRFIDANLHREGVDMAEVVAAAGASRATLYRLFAPYGGLAKFMWSRRLDKAREALSDPKDRRPAFAIAEAMGFSDPAHFTRAFKAEFGIRPSDLRAGR